MTRLVVFLVTFALIALGTSHIAVASQASRPEPDEDSMARSPLAGLVDFQAELDAAATGQGWDQIGGGVRSSVGEASVVAVDNDGNLYVGGTFLWAGEECSSYEGCEGIAMWDGDAWHPLGTGIVGALETLVFDSQGNLYAGGRFQGAGACTAAEGCSNIAMWDGESWSGFGDGIGEQIMERVYALAIDSLGNLYAGGDFRRAGGCTTDDGCANLAMWNGAAWGPVGGGVRRDILPSVEALLVDADDHLYAGGNFTSAGTCTSVAGCRGIAYWDGQIWSPVGGGIEGRIAALGMDSSGDLYASGFFSRAGTCRSVNGCNNIARWDGAAWNPLGSGLEGWVGFLAVDGSDNLYSRGTNLEGAACPEGDECQPITRWDGAGWSELGLLSGGFSTGANSLAVDAAGVLYAGGNFMQAGACTTSMGCNNIAQWDGAAWSALESGLHGRGLVHAVVIDDQNQVYIGGRFLRAGNCSTADGCQGIARWDGSAWHPLGSGLAGVEIGTVNALHLDDDGNLYTAGQFAGVGDCTGVDGCRNIARWDGTTWHALGSGVNGVVSALAHDDDGNLYAAGHISGAGDCDEADGCRRIAMWDGAEWSPLGSGIVAASSSTYITALVMDEGGNLFVGGRFAQAGACTSANGCKNVAMWDGAAWHALDSGIGTVQSDIVYTLGLDASGNLIAGGGFRSAGECTSADGCNSIARWDGATWHALGSGIHWSSPNPGNPDGGPRTLAVDRTGQLYAGGRFEGAGECSIEEGCQNIARWDGREWCSMDGSAADLVYALAAGDTLIAGGAFSQVGACTAAEGCSGVASWTTSPYACRITVYLPSVTSLE